MWQRLQSREKYMIALLVIIGFCFVFYRFVAKDQLLHFIEMKNTLKNIGAKISAAEQAAGSLEREVEFLNRAEKQLNDLKPLFSNEMNDGLALARIGLEAVNAKVEILSYTPLPAIDRDVYLELPVKVAVRGSYPDVVNFIAWLESQSNLSEIRSFKIDSPAWSGPGVFKSGEAEPQDGLGGHRKNGSNGKADLPVPAAFDGDGGAKDAETVSGQGAMPLHGIVVASFDIIIYSLPSPTEKLKLPPVAEGDRGRANPFLEAKY